MLKKLIFGIFAFVVSSGLYAQGTLKGVVSDKANGETIPFANIVIKDGGTTVSGGMTDFDGKYKISQIPVGKYSVEVSYMGYSTIKIQGMQISGGKIMMQNFKMSSDAVTLGVVEVIEYKVKLIDPDQTSSGGTVTSDDIAKMPGRSAEAVVATVGGVYSEDGTIGSVRGARKDATVYYVDGVKVRGSNSVPQSAIAQISVLTGGLSANYGDVTGGVISITTKGPPSKMNGNIEVITSELLDNQGYSLFGFGASGPLVKVKVPGTDDKRTLVGFLLSGEVGLTRSRISSNNYWSVKDEILDSMINHPLRPSGLLTGGVYSNTNFLNEESFDPTNTTKNTNSYSVNIAGKVGFEPVKGVNVTFGGSIDYANRTNFSYSRSLFNSDNNSQTLYSNTRLYGRLTQKFSDKTAEEEKKSPSLIKNAFYKVQVDYSNTQNKMQSARHKDNLFDYGYIGKYTTTQARTYQRGTDTLTGKEAWIQNAFADVAYDFEGADVNKPLANYTQSVIDLYNESFLLTLQGPITNSDLLQANGGYLNGTIPGNIYGLWEMPGKPYDGPDTRYFGYSTYDVSQVRVTASGSADVKDHEITVGFEFEQRTDRNFQVQPTALWTKARQLMNSHITQLDFSNPHPVYDANGVFQDTINYDRLYSASEQSLFDIKFREHLNMPIDGHGMNDYIDIDSYDPSELSLDYFSADELINGGTQLVSYYGFDHHGNKLNSNPSLNDFFTEKDEYGNFKREVAAFQPSYMAGYIMDKFAYGDLIFNVGLRVDRYDANQKVLKDPYSLYETYTVSSNDPNHIMSNTDIPSNIGDDFVVYVNSVNNPTAIVGYRNGNVWYNDLGEEIGDPTALYGASGIAPYLVDPEEDLNVNAFEDYTPQVTLMPRVAFSFPISEDALFFAHYDVLSKRPTSAANINPIQYQYLNMVNSDPINNPNQKNEKTIDYEIGFNQKLSSVSAIKLSAFYKEMRDMQQVISVAGAYPVNYMTYGNMDYGTVKGFTGSFDLRRVGNVSMRASYTLQFADGTGSDVSTALDLIKAGQPNLRTIFPLNYDQRHNISLSFDYRYDGSVNGRAYNGPNWFGINVFENTGANLTVSSGSGSPYTRRTQKGTTYLDSDGGTLVGTVNGSLKPWRTNIDMKIDRDFLLKWGKKDENGDKQKKSYLNAYISIFNLLDAKNIFDVYSSTANPDDDGYLNDPDTQSTINTQLDSESYRNYYSMIIDRPGNYALPRRIRVGLSLNF